MVKLRPQGNEKEIQNRETIYIRDPTGCTLLDFLSNKDVDADFLSVLSYFPDRYLRRRLPTVAWVANVECKMSLYMNT